MIVCKHVAVYKTLAVYKPSPEIWRAVCVSEWWIKLPLFGACALQTIVHPFIFVNIERIWTPEFDTDIQGFEAEEFEGTHII